ncbi:Transcriptional regulator of aromatic amino acids metabolism [Planctomycetales bacterium 10988]|nr:Transcriptional regulator of aromatic amino acids metabolism [Planctomycetales bacterium 10988]
MSTVSSVQTEALNLLYLDPSSKGDSLETNLREAGYQVTRVHHSGALPDTLNPDIAIVLFAIDASEASPQDLFAEVQRVLPDAVQVAYTSKKSISETMQTLLEMYDWEVIQALNLPKEFSRLRRRIENKTRLTQDNRQLRLALGDPVGEVHLVARSSRMQKLMQQAHQVADLDSSLLITGQSGTGKTTLARWIHAQSPRAHQPLVMVSCASLPRELIESELFGHQKGAFTSATHDRPGRAEIAHRGTLFLDEIGELPLELQPKLLTFLQDRVVTRIGSNKARRVDVRVIAATNQDLEKMCQEREFREDLFYRLNVLNLRLPPLAKRREDLPELIEATLDRITTRRGIPPFRVSGEAMAALLDHPWPGNLRELENELERAAAFCEDGILRRSNFLLEAPVPKRTPGEGLGLAGMTLAEIEREAIRETLRYCQGNKAAAARQLGISEKSIYNKMRRHGLFPTY